MDWSFGCLPSSSECGPKLSDPSTRLHGPIHRTTKSPTWRGFIWRYDRNRTF
jgi:hypothetical protein